MSVRFQIARVAIHLTGLKRIFVLPEDELLARARRMNEGRGFRIPDRRPHYEDVRILKATSHKSASRRRHPGGRCCSSSAAGRSSARTTAT